MAATENFKNIFLVDLLVFLILNAFLGACVDGHTVDLDHTARGR